jgi:hypothetical protein
MFLLPFRYHFAFISLSFHFRFAFISLVFLCLSLRLLSSPLGRSLLSSCSFFLLPSLFVFFLSSLFSLRVLSFEEEDGPYDERSIMGKDAMLGGRDTWPPAAMGTSMTAYATLNPKTLNP